jgi:NADH dehydrogenase
MGDIVIIGGGFAGLEAVRVLVKNRKKLGARRVIVIDAKPAFDFLPVLPDVCGSVVPREHATLDLREYLGRLKVNFENDEVTRIDTQAGEVVLKKGSVLSYEFLVLACGTVTNFYGNADAARRALKCDTADDALMILNTVSTYPSKKVLVIGGGYTGVEIAGHVASFLRRRRIKKYSVSIVEKGEDILGPLAEWIRDYARVDLCALRVHVVTDASLKEIADSRVKLSNGMEFEDPLLIWAAGVQTPAFVRDLKFEKDGQGRLFVDPFLRFSDACFAVGDVAAFRHKGKTLRMAVQFSVAQAGVAAHNILRCIASKKALRSYRPLDLGLLVPTANKKAVGKVLFFRAWGLVGWFFHYAMCVYRSIGAKNKCGIALDCLRRVFR